MVRHGKGKGLTCLLCVPADEGLVEAIAALTGKPVTVIQVGKSALIPLQLEKDQPAGQVKAELFDPATKRWKSTISVSRYR